MLAINELGKVSILTRREGRVLRELRRLRDEVQEVSILTRREGRVLPMPDVFGNRA